MGRWSIILERSARQLGLFLCLCAIFVIAFALVRATALEYVYPEDYSSRTSESGDGDSSWAFLTWNENVLSSDLYTILSSTYFAFMLASFGFYPVVPGHIKNTNR